MSSSEVWLDYMKELERRADAQPDEIEAKPTKQRKDNKTPEERREAKNVYMRAYMRERRANETPEQREARLTQKRSYNRERRANETPEKREARLAQKREYAQKRRAEEKKSKT